jgi:tetratricopeptide (TPR) repeat protein
MHEERDFLRTRVFPELEERLRARRHHLEWVDLRVGIATASAVDEQARELQVLKVCLAEVQRCRPFLIVLLGDRYGWVPPADRIGAAAAEQGFSADVAGRSVTDLEIDFGVFGDPEQQQRSFFYFREPLPYPQMPASVAARYSDAHCFDAAAPDRVHRLALLKYRIDRALPARVRRYSAQWDRDRQRVIGLEAWGQMVLEDIWTELDAETAPPARQAETSWQQSERDALDDFVEDRARGFVGRQRVLAPLEELASSPAAADAVWGCCIVGDPGSGKSALFSELYRRLQIGEALVLAHAAGASVRSASVDSMLLRWIGELAGALGIDAVVPIDSNPGTIDATFAALLGRLAEQRRVVVLLDALDQFETTTRGRFATWVPRLWPPNARLIATAIPGDASKVLSARPQVGLMSLPALDAAEARTIAATICARYHREFEVAVLDALIAKNAETDPGETGPRETCPAWGNPLWLVLAVEELNLLDADDFTRADRGHVGAPAERLRALLLDTVVNFPTDIRHLYRLMFERAADLFGAVVVGSFLGLIAVSRAGWRESDFRILLPRLSGESWDELHFATLRRLFRGQLRLRGVFACWDFNHVQMRVAVRSYVAMLGIAETALHTAIADRLLSCSSQDPLRATETMVHLLGSGNLTRAANYYVEDLAEDEREGAANALVDHLVLAPDQQDAARQIAGFVDAPDLDRAVGTRSAELHLVHLDPKLAHRVSLEARLTLLERTSDALEVSVLGDHSNPMRQLLLAAARNNVGEIAHEGGRDDLALAAFQAAAATAESVHGNTLENQQARHSLAHSHEGIGDISLVAGRSNQAFASFERALAIREECAAANPDNDEWKLTIAVATSKIGEALLQTGKPAEALAAFNRGLAITQLLVAAKPDDAWLRSKLAIYYERVGIASMQIPAGEAAALEALRRCHDIRSALAAADPGSNELQSGLLAATHLMAEVLLQSRPLEALELYETGISITQKLMAVDRGNDVWLRGGLVSHFGQAKSLAALGLRDEAIKAFRRCIQIAEGLAKSTPGSIMWQVDLADSLYRAGLCGDFPHARFGSALAILRRLDAEGKLPAAASKMMTTIEQALAALRQQSE